MQQTVRRDETTAANEDGQERAVRHVADERQRARTKRNQVQQFYAQHSRERCQRDEQQERSGQEASGKHHRAPPRAVDYYASEQAEAHIGQSARRTEHAHLKGICREDDDRSEEHTSELQSQSNLVCRLLLEKKKKKNKII